MTGKYESGPFKNYAPLSTFVTASYVLTPEQIGIDKRKHRRIADRTRTLLVTSRGLLCH